MYNTSSKAYSSLGNLGVPTPKPPYSSPTATQHQAGDVEGFLGERTCTPESHLCPHAACQEQLATLSHVMLSCPVSRAVWHWFAATWTAVTQQPAPPLHADLLLADDEAWSLAACRRTGQLVAAASLAGHHAAVGCLLPRQITARAADAAGAHRSESHLCSQDPDAARLAACRLRHQAPGWGAQPLAQRTAAHHDC